MSNKLHFTTLYQNTVVPLWYANITWKLNLCINGKSYLIVKFRAKSQKNFPTSLFCENSRDFFFVKILIHRSSKFYKIFACIRSMRHVYLTAQKWFLWIWSHLLKKSLMENFNFCTVSMTSQPSIYDGTFSKSI